MGTATRGVLDDFKQSMLTGYSLWMTVSIVVALLAALYTTVLADMVQAWNEEPGASHGFLIPPLAFYLAWIRRKVTLEQKVCPDNRGVWLLALGCLVFLVGRVGAEFFLTRISLLILLAGLIWTFWGIARLRTLSFPLLLLVTMVPLPAILYNGLAVPLQLFASEVATSLAQHFGVSVYRDGNIISLAQTSLGVAEACSGLHSLAALMVASLLLGFLYSLGGLRRVLLFVASVPIAIAVNVLRVTGTAILADHQPELAMGFYHSFSSWLIFLVGFGLVAGLAKVLERPSPNPSPAI